MAKKSRRKRSANKSAKSTQPASIASTAKAEPGSTLDEASGSNDADFTGEYVYVYNDLRTILAITVLMLIVMVGLSFVI